MDDLEAFKRKIEQLLQSGETEIILPLQQIQEMKNERPLPP